MWLDKEEDVEWFWWEDTRLEGGQLEEVGWDKNYIFKFLFRKEDDIKGVWYAYRRSFWCGEFELEINWLDGAKVW